MPVEELAGSIFKGIFRILIFIILEVFWDVTCLIIGKITLRILTLGKYPPKDKEYCEWCVQIFGLIILLSTFFTIINLIA